MRRFRFLAGKPQTFITDSGARFDASSDEHQPFSGGHTARSVVRTHASWLRRSGWGDSSAGSYVVWDRAEQRYLDADELERLRPGQA